MIDPNAPWKLSRPSFAFPPYDYKTSSADWETLLARAKQGDPESEWEVADRYEEGCKDANGNILIRRSSRKAAQWFRRAAEHGSTGAQISLGNYLGNGTGIAKDVPEALFWYKKAFRADHTLAADNIAITYRENGNLRAAVQWFRKSVAAGNGEATIQLGVHHYWGKGVRRNPIAAVQCFRKATKSKNICEAARDDAFFYLGLAYLEGKGVKKSIPTAWKLFVRANVDNDHPPALAILQQLGQLKS